MTSPAPSSPPSPGPTAAAPRPVRGLLDAVLVVGLAWAVYASTPAGAIVETGIRIARGQRDHPSWLATFRGRETAVATPTMAPAGDAVLAGRLPAPLERAARDTRVDVDVLAAFVAARGQCDDDGACAARAPDDTFTPALAGAAGHLVGADVIADALARTRADLVAAGVVTADDAAAWMLAVEALFIGPRAVGLAVAQARASRHAAAEDVDVHAPFLPPSVRRGPLQGALAVLLVHRLRTLAWPGEGFRVTSSFGDRVHPITGRVSFHNGVDIGMPTGTPVPSAQAGVVTRAARDSLSGNYVIVDHGLGVTTAYCHLDAHGVAERQRVARRFPVGPSGSTGRSTGPHLHYVLRLQGKAVDPEAHGERAQTQRPASAPTSGTAPAERGAPGPRAPVGPAESVRVEP
jgi:murein DD-endopeptidase MepM/ murein hydrolase activator NlpD